MKRAAACVLTALFLMASLSVVYSSGLSCGHVNGAPTRATVTGNEKNSTGLPQSSSFTTVATWDADDDNKYEIYLGGAGRTNPRTQGIYAFEFSTSTSSWSAFGSGLPGSSSGEYYGALGLGDVNKDGNLDIVAPIPSQWYATSTNAVEIWTSSSSHAFSKAHAFSPGKSTNQAIVEDLDGDSNPDIVFSYYGGLKAYFGSGSATSWTESSPTASGYEMDGVAAGDLNHDGLLDLVATPYFSTRKIFMYIQGSSRSWSEVSFKQTTNEAFGVQIADLNGDGDNDVVYGTRGEGIKVWCGNGGGSSGGTSFTWTDNSSGLPTSGGDWNQLEFGDVDQDGDPDIITISSGQDRARIFINNQPGSWTELFTSSVDHLTVGGSGYGANFVDLDGDGDLDAVACSWGGGIDAYTIHTSGTTPPPPPPNRRPVPDAGEDREVMLGETVRLDGTASTDPEDAPEGDTAGTELTYDWNVTRYPAGSMIRDSSLSPSETSAKPSFIPDRAGAYELSLRVKDQDDDWSNESDTDTVSITVTKPNDPPVADAGPDRSAFIDDTVELDGSGSYDIDGSIVLHEWRCLSHTVEINSDDQVSASFTPDVRGTFVISLRVQDDNGTWSTPDEVLITAIQRGQNLPPNADAGPDRAYNYGETVTLDGSGSTDLDGEILTWEWTCTSHPPIVFTNMNSSSPSFVPAVGGSYLIQLRVMDDNRSWSAPDTVTITIIQPDVNEIPVANAGTDLSATVGDLVTLDGRDSYDPDGFIEEYNWTCTSHTVNLMNALTARPSFVPDAEGRYVFKLAVSDDGGAWSGDDEVVVDVSPVPVAERYTITLGPFLTEDDDPLVGAVVHLIRGPSSRTGTIDVNGLAVFEDVEGGIYNVKVSVDGKDVITLFQVTVEDGGSVSVPGGYPKAPVAEDPEPDDDDEEEDDDQLPSDADDPGPGMIIAALVIMFLLALIGGGAALFFHIRNRDQDEENEKKEEDHPPKDCPKCGGEMNYDNDFSRYRCESCGRYS